MGSAPAPESRDCDRLLYQDELLGRFSESRSYDADLRLSNLRSQIQDFGQRFEQTVNLLGVQRGLHGALSSQRRRIVNPTCRGLEAKGNLPIPREGCG